MRYLYKDLNLCFHQSWYLAQLITKLMSTPVPNHPQGMGMTFPFSRAPGLIQPERERCLCSRGQPCAVRLPPQRRGSSKRKRLCFGSASHAQQSSFWAPQFYAQCSACGWAIRRRGARQCETLPVPCLQSTEPAALLPFQEPLLGQGGHQGVSNGCCITFPDASSLFSQKKNKAVLKTTLSVEQLTKNKNTNKT